MWYNIYLALILLLTIPIRTNDNAICYSVDLNIGEKIERPLTSTIVFSRPKKLTLAQKRVLQEMALPAKLRRSDYNEWIKKELTGPDNILIECNKPKEQKFFSNMFPTILKHKDTFMDSEYFWFWCDVCETPAIQCPKCQNTSCNGGGCTSCDEAFLEAQKTILSGKAPSKLNLPKKYSILDLYLSQREAK